MALKLRGKTPILPTIATFSTTMSKQVHLFLLKTTNRVTPLFTPIFSSRCAGTPPKRQHPLENLKIYTAKTNMDPKNDRFQVRSSFFHGGPHFQVPCFLFFFRGCNAFHIVIDSSNYKVRRKTFGCRTKTILRLSYQDSSDPTQQAFYISIGHPSLISHCIAGHPKVNQSSTPTLSNERWGWRSTMLCSDTK